MHISSGIHGFLYFPFRPPVFHRNLNIGSAKGMTEGVNGALFALIFGDCPHIPSRRHCDKKSIAKRSHANVQSDFRNQTFAQERLAVDF